MHYRNCRASGRQSPISQFYCGLHLVLFKAIRQHHAMCIGIMAVLLQELIAVFPLLSPPTLSSPASTRVCNVLALMQCIASHPETRRQFLEAQIPNFLYPCLNASSKARPFEYLRLTCLGVIGALVKNDSPEVIEYLMSTEIVPLCLQIMESGNELSRTVPAVHANLTRIW